MAFKNVPVKVSIFSAQNQEDRNNPMVLIEIVDGTHARTIGDLRISAASLMPALLREGSIPAEMKIYDNYQLVGEGPRDADQAPV